MSIAENYRCLCREIPAHVRIVLAVKRRTAEEVAEAVAAGARELGQNYVQEAESLAESLGRVFGPDAPVIRWHMIGALQKNKINKALQLFDTVQTVHSVKQALDLGKRAEAAGRDIEVMLEINSGKELTKSGLLPRLPEVREAAEAVASQSCLRLSGFMTMGPAGNDPARLRACFRATRGLFDDLNALDLPGIRMDTLSMGMSDSYIMAIEEGSNLIRPGTIIFGPRMR